jgi:hypothetical protein
MLGWQTNSPFDGLWKIHVFFLAEKNAGLDNLQEGATEKILED